MIPAIVGLILFSVLGLVVRAWSDGSILGFAGLVIVGLSIVVAAAWILAQLT